MYDLFDESIESEARFFVSFLLHWHEGTVDEIEQLAKEYDSLLPKTHPDSKEIHEENVEYQSKQLEENIIEDLIEEASHGPLFEDISEQPPDKAIIEDVELPQAYEQLHVEDEKLPQVHFEINNTCIADLPHERLLNDKS